VSTNKPLLGPKLGWVDMLDIKTQEANDKEAAAPVTRTPLRPSSAGKCERELAYSYAEFKGKASYPKEAISPEVTRTFALGHSVEYVLLNQFKQHCKDLIQVKYTQQGLTFCRLPDGTLLEGSLDAVFYSKEHRAIIDVKSKKDKYSNYYSSSWDEMNEKLKRLPSIQALTDLTFYADNLEAFLDEVDDPFLADNFFQLNYYACNPYIVERGIDHAAIIQFNKNDSRIREIRFRPSTKLYEYVTNKFMRVATLIETDQGPEAAHKEFVLGNIKCAFCNYRAECWPRNNATKDYWRSMPDKKWPKDTDRMGHEGVALEALIEEYATLKEAEPAAKRAEAKALKLMQDLGVSKIRLQNGSIYEIKVLKDSIQLRRGKL